MPEPLSDNFTWTVHPARRRPAAAVGAALVIAAFAALVGIESADIWWPLLSVAVLVLALNRFFFPSRYEVDAEGITVRHACRTRRLTWRQVRRFAHDGRGGMLSTRGRPSRFSASGTITLLFDDDAPRAIERIDRAIRRAAVAAAHDATQSSTKTVAAGVIPGNPVTGGVTA
jgi:Bacterial PH domain